MIKNPFCSINSLEKYLILQPIMAWKRKYRCKACGYEAETYEGRGLFRQQIVAMSCPDCHTIQNIVVGGIIADVAPSYRRWADCACSAAATKSNYGTDEPVRSVRALWSKRARRNSGRSSPYFSRLL